VNILLLEPDRLLAEIYAQTLIDAGHRVVVCSGAQTAIMAADQLKPDLVILELQLIEHSSIEFLYEFRSYQDWQSIPVLIHTLVPPDEFNNTRQLLGNELGVRAYLYKPRTSLRQLVAAVGEQLPVEA
jgi:DNA-binding response OmpR family regulator